MCCSLCCCSKWIMSNEVEWWSGVSVCTPNLTIFLEQHIPKYFVPCIPLQYIIAFYQFTFIVEKHLWSKSVHVFSYTVFFLNRCSFLSFTARKTCNVCYWETAKCKSKSLLSDLVSTGGWISKVFGQQWWSKVFGQWRCLKVFRWY